MPNDDPAIQHTGEPQPCESVRPAILDLASHLRLWTVGAAALALDLWTKSWAFEALGPTDVYDAIPGILTFRRSVNPGALFGMGKGLVPLFIAASIVALVFVIYLFATSGANRRSLHLALGCVLAGSFGNMYDRTFIIADRVSIDGAEPFVGKVVDDDPESATIMIGAAPDGAMPHAFPRAGVEVSQIGVVRDFLKFEPKVAGYDVWPWVFNIADSMLVIGVAVLMLNFWFDRGAHAGTLPPAVVAADAPSP